MIRWMGQRNPENQLIGGKHPIIYRQDFAGPSTVLFGTHGTQKNARNPALTMDTRPGMAVSENICQGE